MDSYIKFGEAIKVIEVLEMATYLTILAQQRWYRWRRRSQVLSNTIAMLILRIKTSTNNTYNMFNLTMLNYQFTQEYIYNDPIYPFQGF